MDTSANLTAISGSRLSGQARKRARPITTRILTVFGTRPEAIKLAPVVRRLEREPGVEALVCVTSQHRDMLDQVLKVFEIKPHYDLDVIRPNQDLARLTTAIIDRLTPVLHSCRPDLVLVQGDTTTSFSATLSAFYERIPVGHVEAGLRTADLSSPWPEEANRRMTGVLATFHFAPTECARRNLLLERVPAAHIVVTGNTVLDALLDVRARIACDRQLKRSFAKRFGSIDFRHKIILVTGHRRENLGQGLKSICRALIDLAAREDVEIVYPVHLNPNVRTPVHELLGGIPRIHLLEPLDYLAFVFLMSRCYLIISDSGGIQEEAPSLGKPVIVTRNTTERPEALEADAILLVGTERRTIVKAASRLLDDAAAYRSMARANNLFGDGRASEKIVSFLSSALGWSNETLSSGRSERVAQFVPTEPLAQDQAYEGGIGP